MKFVLATHNSNKVKEMTAQLAALGVEVISQDEAGVNIEVEETGTTFTENATLKAEAVMRATGLPAIADDSGICVAGLNGGPGVYSARFGGEGLNDCERTALMLEMLHGVTDRSAYYHSSIVCIFPNGDKLVAEGECHGSIGFAPIGDGGFGYDPVFFLRGMNKTFAQISPEEKAQHSHRGIALRDFAQKLAVYLKR